MDKLAALRELEKLAAKLRRLGLHPVTKAGRYIASKLFGDITIQVSGLTLTGSVLHRGYLWSLREGLRENYMAELFKDAIQPGMIVCDIGSYIGLYALLAAQCVKGSDGKVYAFEPDPHNFAYLVRNIRLNRFEDVIVPIQKAVAHRSGELSFYICGSDRSRNSLFRIEGDTEKDTKQLTVQSLALDEFLKTEVVNVIKMDIEGGEIHVFRGMDGVLTRSNRVLMLVECNPKALRAAGGNARQLLDMLWRYGFQIQIIDESERQLKPLEWDAQIENVKYVNLYCYRGN